MATPSYALWSWQATPNIPRFATLTERGLDKADKIATDVWDLAHARDAYLAAADRSVVSAHVIFN